MATPDSRECAHFPVPSHFPPAALDNLLVASAYTFSVSIFSVDEAVRAPCVFILVPKLPVTRYPAPELTTANKCCRKSLPSTATCNRATSSSKAGKMNRRASQFAAVVKDAITNNLRHVPLCIYSIYGICSMYSIYRSLHRTASCSTTVLLVPQAAQPAICAALLRHCPA